MTRKGDRKIIKSIVMIATLCVVTGLSVNAQGGRASRTSPEAVVANLYKQHKKASPFFQTRSRLLLSKYFDKQLADLLWKDATTARGEVGALNGDPLYNAQDMEIKNFSIGKAAVQNGKAQVKVSFANFDRKEEIVFDLVSGKSGWSVSNLGYRDGTTLVDITETGPTVTHGMRVDTTINQSEDTIHELTRNDTNNFFVVRVV